MTAKEYLWKINENRIALAQIDESIRTKRERIAELHQSIESISAITYDGPKVQTSPTDSMSEKVARLTAKWIEKHKDDENLKSENL